MARRLLLTVTLALAATLLPAAGASACSCAKEDVRMMLRQADAAFVGKLVSVKKLDPEGQGIQRAVFVFKLERAVKGRLGRRVHVHSNTSGASCGFDLRRGQRVGLMLRRRHHRWESGLCDQVWPRDLVRGARGTRAAASCAA